MSMETPETLNDGRCVKLGNTLERGESYAWHHNPYIAMIVAAKNGGIPQYYPGPIPVQDVIDHMLNWEALTAPVAFTDHNGVSHETSDQVIYRSDTSAVLKTGFKEGYLIHQFQEWLIERIAKLTGVSVADAVNIANGTDADMLQLSSFGLLKGGAQAWAQFELPESIETPSGLKFRPSLLAGTSHDGTIATMAKLVYTMVVCDNTFATARGERRATVKAKHTKNSGRTFDDGANALGIVRAGADEFSKDLEALIARPVTTVQFGKFLDIWQPIPAEDSTSKRAVTMAERTRATLEDLYSSDAMVAPFAGSAFGVLQLTNTYNQHHAPVNTGTDRIERRFSRALSDELANKDSEVIAILDTVLA